jgi:hypothetical protein
MQAGGPQEQEHLASEEDARIFAKQVDKLFLLLEHFGIPRTDGLRWFCLVFQLARQHVPGMKTTTGPKTRRGRKTIWGESGLDAELVYLVRVVERERRKGITDAIRIVMKRYPDEWGQFPQQSLRTRYFEAVRRMKPDRSGDLIQRFEAWLLSDESPK